MTVKSIDETQRFYAKHFGFTPSRKEPLLISDSWFGEGVEHEGAQVKIGWLRRDDAAIELHEYVVPADGRRLGSHVVDIGAPHLAFKVDDIDAVYAGLAADGIRFYSAIQEVAAAGSAAEIGGIRWCYCEDPNGYIVELFAEPVGGEVDWGEQMAGVMSRKCW
jgi:catechol 2,3-dioxygenase-like lactoylglutathione lyase family enzyme